MWDAMDVSFSDKQGSMELAHSQTWDMISNQVPNGLSFLSRSGNLEAEHTPRGYAV